ncbi:uncharacterized protein N7529_010508 [Penicillium soppii]|jgi:succinate dehydrogenase/fumarate reductase flavoprotein subunit|uniref:uncharacterized protein n=1 Tax=Penicillium soppii TaxID=69789 RepID=UPI00254764FC|nr:uncharacterized protein N7529_010508 [Penicillium soppii]KAJ5856564.1 hypothetical protein N7529_010508 [Penicillium soppii]
MLCIAQRDVNAKSAGKWSGCFRVVWDANADAGDRNVSNEYTNWALPIDKPPFLAVKITAGISFTFGGLALNPDTSAVISDTATDEARGLHCVGEMLEGIFYESNDNFPGGSALTSGTVLGRRAGRAAAETVGKVARLEL